MSSRRKPKPTPSPSPSKASLKTPGTLTIGAIIFCGLIPQLWLAGVVLLPVVFWLTWPGRWLPKHWLMLLGTVSWMLGTLLMLAGATDRASLGLDFWTPPDALVGFAQSWILLPLVLQTAGIGLVVWVLIGGQKKTA
ncbi:MAG: hypothetical protein WAS07_04115 [Micropruina sp.]|nr:hypothetical protein [Micropruina sp.]